MVDDLRLLCEDAEVFGRNDNRYEISTLTDELARRFADRLLELHNLIPHVSWTEKDLLAEWDEEGDRDYLGKWSLSLCAFHEGFPVALLVAFLRNDNVKREKRGLYIHRLAVAREHQRNLLGTQMAQLAIDAYFRVVPGLRIITVQTNDDDDNQGVIGFYRLLGFRDYGRVEYADKQDLALYIRRGRGVGRLRRQGWQRPVSAPGYLNQTTALIQHLASLVTPSRLR